MLDPHKKTYMINFQRFLLFYLSLHGKKNIKIVPDSFQVQLSSVTHFKVILSTARINSFLFNQEKNNRATFTLLSPPPLKKSLQQSISPLKCHPPKNHQFANSIQNYKRPSRLNVTIILQCTSSPTRRQEGSEAVSYCELSVTPN